MTMSVSQQLASFAVTFGYEGLPDHIRRETQRALLNGIAAGLGGSSDAAIAIFERTLRRFAGPPTSTLIGRSLKTDAATAAFINAAAINVLDFDDTHDVTIIHPTAPVAAAVLALAEETGAPGAQVLDAIAIGIEAACRIGNAISPGHYARGWHITATCGVFGAALGCARLLRLDEKQALDALGAASAQSSGLVETLGTMAKSAGVGHAARAGLLSAIFASEGLAGPERPLEGRLGFLHVTADDPATARIVEGLGTTWELQRNMYKPYPCGVVLNPVIDACLALRASGDFEPDEIETVTVTGSELLRMRTDRPNVMTGREAQVSAQHAVAVSLLRGSASARDFNDASVLDTDVLDLRRRVGSILVDASYADTAASVEMTLRTGRTVTKTVSIARGSIDLPLSDPELETKLRTLAAHGAPTIDTDELLRQIAHLVDAPDVRPLMACLSA